MDENMKSPASGSAGDTQRADASSATPLLSAYYENPKMKPPAFVQHVKAMAGPVVFDSEDEKQVLERLDEFDPSLARTGALLGKGPPFRGWVERATEKALDLLMDDADREYSTIMERFRRFLDNATSDLSGKDADKKRRAKTLIRLVFVWMVERRKLDPERALPLIRRKAADSRTTLRQILVAAPYPQLLKLSQVAASYEDIIDKLRKENGSLFSDLMRARKNQDEQAATLEQTQTALRHAEEAHAETAVCLEKVEAELRGERELRAADRRQFAARSRQFLLQRLGPLLADARGALDFNTPHISGSRQRIEMAEAALKKEVERLDG